jgi:hypothetical protein
MGRRIRVLVPRLILSLTGEGYNLGTEIVVSNAQWEILAPDTGTIVTDLGFELTVEETMDAATGDVGSDAKIAAKVTSGTLTSAAALSARLTPRPAQRNIDL